MKHTKISSALVALTFLCSVVSIQAMERALQLLPASVQDNWKVPALIVGTAGIVYAYDRLVAQPRLHAAIAQEKKTREDDTAAIRLQITKRCEKALQQCSQHATLASEEQKAINEKLSRQIIAVQQLVAGLLEIVPASLDRDVARLKEIIEGEKGLQVKVEVITDGLYAMRDLFTKLNERGQQVELLTPRIERQEKKVNALIRILHEEASVPAPSSAEASELLEEEGENLSGSESDASEEGEELPRMVSPFGKVVQFAPDVKDTENAPLASPVDSNMRRALAQSMAAGEDSDASDHSSEEVDE